jgi:hypothetical protein
MNFIKSGLKKGFEGLFDITHPQVVLSVAGSIQALAPQEQVWLTNVNMNVFVEIVTHFFTIFFGGKLPLFLLFGLRDDN